MKILLQNIESSKLWVNGKLVSQIDNGGLLIFIAIAKDDNEKKLKFLVKKILNIKIFKNEQGKLSKNILEKKGNIQVVSQFTLYAEIKKGFRPSFSNSSSREVAVELYDKFLIELKKQFSGRIVSGIFGAEMTIRPVLVGPVTIFLEV